MIQFFIDFCDVKKIGVFISRRKLPRCKFDKIPCLYVYFTSPNEKGGKSGGNLTYGKAMKLYYVHAGRLKIFVILSEEQRYGAASIIAY